MREEGDREEPVSFPEGAPLLRAHLAVGHTQLLYPTALCRRMVIKTGVPVHCLLSHSENPSDFTLNCCIGHCVISMKHISVG